MGEHNTCQDCARWSHVHRTPNTGRCSVLLARARRRVDLPTGYEYTQWWQCCNRFEARKGGAQ
jgi:hypothetical protein